MCKEINNVPNRSEYIQPALMAGASLLSIVAAGVAVYVGADKTPSGDTNPFFYAAATNSTLYFGANMIRIGQIYQARSQTFVEREEERRAANENVPLISVKVRA